ncbi:MAG TPA: Ku protein [Anaerolineales bacterium]|nr:Ku protein [Anaerolineales bacterium]
MRSFWTGAISFGLIYIPVKLYNASETSELSFNLLRRSDRSRIRYVRVAADTGEEVSNDEIVKGYEFSKGEYVVLEDDDFKKANVRKTQTIDIVTFVDAAQVDYKLYEKPYYLEPIKGAAKAYALLREALASSGKVGVGRFVLRNREALGVIKPEGNVIVLNQLRYLSELRDPGELTLPEAGAVPEAELDMAVKLIETLTGDWEPAQYRDTYEDDLRAIIQAKVEGREPEAESEAPIPIEVTDLFAKLSQSLEQAKQQKGENP